MAGRISVYINLIITLIMILVSGYAFTQSKMNSTEDYSFLFIFFVIFGLLLTLDLGCLHFFRNNKDGKIINNKANKFWNVFFVFAILACLANWVLLASLLYVMEDAKYPISKKEQFGQFLIGIMLIASSITSVINLRLFLKLKKINKNLTSSLIADIGEYP